MIGFLLAIAAGEALIRVSGRTAWRESPRAVFTAAREPILHEEDSALGWRMKAGRYEIPPYGPGGSPIQMTVLPDGSRYTGDVDPEGRRKLVFVGGSFMQGWAVTDEATLPISVWIFNIEGSAALPTSTHASNLRAKPVAPMSMGLATPRANPTAFRGRGFVS
jgi:hypothetical protein